MSSCLQHRPPMPLMLEKFVSSCLHLRPPMPLMLEKFDAGQGAEVSGVDQAEKDCHVGVTWSVQANVRKVAQKRHQ